MNELVLRDRPGGVRSGLAADMLVKSGLKLNHLRLIVAIAETGQISAAADVLSISQPAASRMLTEMEAIVRAPLCERVARGVALTMIGQAMARRARAILIEIREADREIGELKTGYGGTVTLGAVTAPAISLAVPAILDVAARFPGIELNVNIETSNLLTRNLLAARYDFVIGRIPDDLNPRLFSSEPIGVEKACIIVRNGHPLLGRGPANLADLSPMMWVHQPEGSLLRRTIENLFMSKGVPLPASTVNTQSILLTMAVICNSDAVAPVARDVADFVATHSAAGERIVILPTDFDIVTSPYSMITAAGRALTPSARLVHDMILDKVHG